jgi:hypothetical protein
MWINSSLRWLLEFFVQGRDKAGDHLRRIRPGGRYYDRLHIPGRRLECRTVEFLMPGSRRSVPETTYEYRVFFEAEFRAATLVRTGQGDIRVSLRS